MRPIVWRQHLREWGGWWWWRRRRGAFAGAETRGPDRSSLPRCLARSLAHTHALTLSVSPSLSFPPPLPGTVCPFLSPLFSLPSLSPGVLPCSLSAGEPRQSARKHTHRRADEGTRARESDGAEMAACVLNFAVSSTAFLERSGQTVWEIAAI